MVQYLLTINKKAAYAAFFWVSNFKQKEGTTLLQIDKDLQCNPLLPS
jgi:hypothetical protein